MSLKVALNKVLRERVGYEVRSTRAAPPRTAKPDLASLGKSAVLYDIDEEFAAIALEGVARTGTSEGGPNDGFATPGLSPLHRARLYNLAQAVRMTDHVEGLLAECGCFQGLSVYVACRILRSAQADFDGTGFHVFDSFAGLSDLVDADAPDDPSIPVGGRPREAGMFAATIDQVRDALVEFPGTELHEGWIPDVLAEAPEGPYRLVHIDLDIHDPTRDSLEHFYPRLAPGGVIVCDDYGSVRWPGSRKAVDAFCAQTGAPLLALTTGQALVFCRPR